MDYLVLKAEREIVDAGTAVVVVIQRAVVIVRVAIGVMGMITAFVMLVGACRVGRLMGGEYARIQPGKEAEDHQPCEKVAHA